MPTSWCICIYASISGRIYAYTCRNNCVYIYIYIANKPANNQTIYTYMHICTSAGIYAYMQGYGGAYMYTCMIWKYMCIYSCMYAYRHASMEVYMQRCWYICIYASIYGSLSADMLLCAYMQVYMEATICVCE